MGMYKTKPKLVEAIQVFFPQECKKNLIHIEPRPEWFDDAIFNTDIYWNEYMNTWYCKCYDGISYIKDGDFVIKYEDGLLDVISSEYFNEKYESA